jgi:hypothetical protein
MSITVHPFDHAVKLSHQTDGIWQGHTDPAYGNMVGPFGGVTSAVLLNAILKDKARIGDPISLTVNFAGPIEDGPFTIEAMAFTSMLLTVFSMFQVTPISCRLIDLF